MIDTESTSQSQIECSMSQKDLEFTNMLLQQKKEEKECKHFHINDNMNLLSKNQKAKIKNWLKENDFEEEKLLSTIFFPPSVKNKYNRAYKMWDEKEKLYQIQFVYEIPKREILKKKLREKQHQLRNGYRPAPGENKTNKKLWEMYEHLKSIPQIRAIPAGVLEVALPNPDKIQENKSMYESYLTQIPNSAIKDYFKLCLAN
jgi:hypothetical protein